MKLYNIISWSESLEIYKKRLELQKPKDFNFFEITLDINEADVICIHDSINIKYKNILDLKPIHSKIILVQREPSYINRLDRNLLKICDCSTLYETNSPCISVWWLDLSYDYLKELKYKKEVKEKHLVCVTSLSRFTHGQKMRMDWLANAQKFLEIDFYGRGDLKNIFKNYIGPPELFTSTNNINKIRDKSIIGKYNKSISFENGSTKNFVNRLHEDLLMWTLPIYWGCPNIEEIFPKNSYRYIDITKPINKETIDYINKPVTNEEINAIDEARNLVLDKYNWWFHIYNIIKDL